MIIPALRGLVPRRNAAQAGYVRVVQMSLQSVSPAERLQASTESLFTGELVALSTKPRYTGSQNALAPPSLGMIAVTRANVRLQMTLEIRHPFIELNPSAFGTFER